MARLLANDTNFFPSLSIVEILLARNPPVVAMVLLNFSNAELSGPDMFLSFLYASVRFVTSF